MKKTVVILVGGIAIIIVGVLVGRQGTHRTQEGDEPQSVEQGMANNEPSAGESRRDGSGTGQGLQDAGDTVASDGDVASTKEILSDAVKALLGQDGKKHNYPSLLKAINELDQEMSATDVAALMDMLNFANDRFPEKMRPIEINAVKNDVLDKLLSQKDLPEGLGLQMVEMAGNAENDPVWRDYCVQFMEPFYERRSKVGKSKVEGQGAGGESHVEQAFQPAQSADRQTGKFAPQDELSAIHDAMFQALDERGETLAGTALIGLELLSRTHDEFDRETIVEKSVEIAGDEMASAASRLTALRLASMTSRPPEGGTTNGERNAEVVDAARSLAQMGETVLLRSAAIVTLGEVGTPDDRELLESYLLADNKQISDAAKMALAKMEAR